MYYLYCIARFLVLILPRSCSYFIAGILSSIKFYISRRDRRAVIFNITPLVENKKELSRRAKRVFNNFAFYLVDFLNTSHINREFIKRYVSISGIGNLNSIVGKKGIIALTAHIGNYELGGSIVSILGYDIHAIAFPHKDRRINDFFNNQRSIFKVKVIPTGRAVVRCIRLLKNKKMVAFLGDRDFASIKGYRVRLCGREALLPKGPSFFALKTDSVIIPSFFVRERKYFYRLIFEPPIFPRYNDGSLKSEKMLIEEQLRILEKYIRRYSDQWYMFQKYWL